MEFLLTEDDPNQPIGNLQTVAMEADTIPPLVELGRKLLAKAQDGDTEAVRDLMSQGAPFTADWLGTSAIHWACQLNHYDTAELLLKAGISRDARNKVDRTPLHVTATEGHVRILKLLLLHGVDVDAVDMLRMTPLHWAAEYGHEECVRLLLEHGADPLALNKFDKTADQIAFDNNRIEITHMIQEYAENPLFQLRRTAAKEKQKKAAASHKANVDRERAQIMKHYTTNSNADKSGEVKATKVQRCKPRIVCDSNLKLIENVGKTEPLSLSPSSTENTMAMLQAHGITMLPNDESSIVASAMQSGQKVVLTEAGKMALTLTQSNMMKPQSTLPIKGLVRLPPDMLRGKKVITIRADQLINMKNERKVIIQNPKKQNKLIRETAPSKAKVEVLVTKQIINNQALFTSSFVEKPTEVEAVPTVPMTVVPPGVDSELVRRIGEESELDRVKRVVEEMNRKLEETTKALDLMTEKYLKQVQETEMYKQKVLNSK